MQYFPPPHTHIHTHTHTHTQHIHIHLPNTQILITIYSQTETHSYTNKRTAQLSGRAFHWDIPYSSKFSWHNIFVNFIVDPLFMNILFTKFTFWGCGLFMSWSWACDASTRFWPRWLLASRNPTLQRQCYLVLPGLSRCKCHPSVSSSRGGQHMRGRRAGENKWLNARVGHKINQTRKIWEVHTQEKGRD